jgi:small subunit ribosomal protein S6
LETAVKKLYEAMFLIDAAQAASDWDGIVKTIRTILEKSGADVISIRKWDDRSLAYPINRMDRGTYIISYFRVQGEAVKTIERDITLSERITRALILAAEHMTQADIEKDTPAMMAEKQPHQPAEEAAVVEAEPVEEFEIPAEVREELEK